MTEQDIKEIADGVTQVVRVAYITAGLLIGGIGLAMWALS